MYVVADGVDLVIELLLVRHRACFVQGFEYFSSNSRHYWDHIIARRRSAPLVSMSVGAITGLSQHSCEPTGRSYLERPSLNDSGILAAQHSYSTSTRIS